MNFFLVVVLHSKYDAKVDSVLVPVLLEHVDQVVEDVRVEEFDVLDYEDDGFVDTQAFSFYDLLHAKEGFFY